MVEPRIGAEISPLVTVPTSRQVVRYAAATGDFYEAHYDKDYAVAHGLPGTITHGLFKLAMFGRAVTGWAGQDAFVRALDADYRGLDRVGSEFRVQGTVTSVGQEGDLWVVSLELRGVSVDGSVSTTGSAVVDFPV